MKSAYLEEFNVTIFEDGAIINPLGKKLKATLDPAGYPRVYVTKKNGKRSGLFVHRAVAMGFIENPENKPCVNHIDGNKQNFSIANLEWCFHKENTTHAYKTGLMKKGTRNPERDREIAELALSKGMNQLKVAEIYGLKGPRVNQIVKNYKAQQLAIK